MLVHRTPKCAHFYQNTRNLHVFLLSIRTALCLAWATDELDSEIVWVSHTSKSFNHWNFIQTKGASYPLFCFLFTKSYWHGHKWQRNVLSHSSPHVLTLKKVLFKVCTVISIQTSLKCSFGRWILRKSITSLRVCWNSYARGLCVPYMSDINRTLGKFDSGSLKTVTIRYITKTHFFLRLVLGQWWST